MVFTQAQIQDMLSILTRYQLTFILNQLGPTYLTAAEKALLLAAGIDVNKYVNKKGVIEHAFYFGILADAIGDERAKKMDYPQFQKFLASGHFQCRRGIHLFQYGRCANRLSLRQDRQAQRSGFGLGRDALGRAGI